VENTDWNVDKKGHGIENQSAEKVLIDICSVPDDVEAIVIVGTIRGNKNDDTIFSSLDTCSLAIRAANQGRDVESSARSSSKSKSKSKSSSSTPTFYDLANYSCTHSDVGAAGSIIVGKIFRRSITAPWEFLPIGTGAVEISVDELIGAPKLDASSQLIIRDNNRGIAHFVRIGWRPIPRHCKVYVLEAKGLPAHPRSGSADPFVSCDAIPKSNYGFDTKLTDPIHGSLNPSWNALFVFKDIGTHPRNEVNIMFTVWDHVSGTNDYIGDVKVNLKRCFTDSVRNGGRSVDMTFPLVKGLRKKVGLVGQTSQRSTCSGELKLRFLCF